MKIIELRPLSKPVTQSVVIPGSKSYTNRALVMASLAHGKSLISGISESNDSVTMINCLKKLGIRIRRMKDQAEVIGDGGYFKKKDLVLDLNHAGTAMRFLTAVVCLVPGRIVLDGSERMRNRPIRELVDALIKLGAKISYLGQTGCPPVVVHGKNIKGGTVCVKGDISSQYFTALLMIGPVLKEKLKIKVLGRSISRSYIDMTIGGLKDFGVRVKNNHYREYLIEKNQYYSPVRYEVEADSSGASYFWAVAALTRSRIKVKNINPLSVQGDIGFADVLKRMGCRIKKNIPERWIEVEGTAKLKGIEVDMSLMPDTAQTLAVVAAFAKGKTKITGLATLKIKETDRLQAIKNELIKMGIKSKTTNDSIIIEGGCPSSCLINTYGDHRMAMAFAVAGSRIEGMKIEDPDVVGKSFPDFWQRLSHLGVKPVLL